MKHNTCFEHIWPAFDCTNTTNPTRGFIENFTKWGSDPEGMINTNNVTFCPDA